MKPLGHRTVEEDAGLLLVMNLRSIKDNKRIEVEQQISRILVSLDRLGAGQRASDSDGSRAFLNRCFPAFLFNFSLTLNS